MGRDGRLPKMSRIDFYRLCGGELISALAQVTLDVDPAAMLRPAHKADMRVGQTFAGRTERGLYPVLL